jgi:hypothetical protein
VVVLHRSATLSVAVSIPIELCFFCILHPRHLDADAERANLPITAAAQRFFLLSPSELRTFACKSPRCGCRPTWRHIRVILSLVFSNCSSHQRISVLRPLAPALFASRQRDNVRWYT